MRRSSLLIFVIYLGYISLGLPDGTFGIAWPSMYPELGLPIGLAGTIIIFGTLVSGFSGFMSGRVIRRYGTGIVMLASCALTGMGLVGMGFATGGLALYLLCIPLGIGAGAVDAGLNGFVARHYSGRHMNWLHACWGSGATSGPLVAGMFMSIGAGWRPAYWAIGGGQLALALLFLATLGLWKHVPQRVEEAGDGLCCGTELKARANSTAGYLSMLAFILYVGVEQMTGIWAGTILIVGRGFGPEEAALCAGSFYASITGGRILVGFIVDRFGNRRLIAAGTLLAVAGAVVFAFADTPYLAMPALIMMGGGFAPVYPCLMHEVPRRFVMEDVTIVISRQTGASYIGGALMPVVGGWIAQVALPLLPVLVVAGTVLIAACVRLLDRATPTSGSH